MTAVELLEALGRTCEVENFIISDIVYDSRKCRENCVFVCLRGAAVDGHSFAAAAAEKGAGLIVAEEPLDMGAVPVIVVENTRKALAVLSARFFGNPSTRLKTIGITGTKGKTTTAFMIQSILESAGYKVGVIGTIGVAIGGEVTKTENTTPESYVVQQYMKEMADKGCDFCVMEVSSIGLKDYRVFGFRFDCGVFTNFSEDHIGGVEHKDMQEYLESKAMLFSMCKVGAVNLDDGSLEGILKGHTCDVLTYGFSEKAQIRGTKSALLSRPGFLGSNLQITGLEEFVTEVGIPGKFNGYNALAAVSACHCFGIPAANMQEGLSLVRVKGRVEPVAVPKNIVPANFTLLIDYAHNAVSMESILSTLREYKPTRLVCLFGAGGNRPKIRRYEMGEVCGNMANLSVITADNSRFEKVEDIIADIKIGMAKTKGEFIEIPDRRAAIRYCIENARDGDIVVLAGKGHEDYQEIEGVKHPFDERVVIAEILASLEDKA